MTLRITALLYRNHGSLEGMTRTKKRPESPAENNRKEKFWKEVRGYIEAFAIAYVVITFIFTTVGVVGSSMDPNLNGGARGAGFLQALLTGDRVFIPKYETWWKRLSGDEYERGAIVVLREPANAPTSLETGRRNFWIKRIVAVPGDRLRIDAGQVIVNGTPIDQSFISDAAEFNIAPVTFPQVVVENGEATSLVIGFQRTPKGNFIPILPVGIMQPQPVPLLDERVQFFYKTVVDNLLIPEDTQEDVPVLVDMIIPDGHYYVMGDNRSTNGSEDSRYFGPIPQIAIAGRASHIIWPPMRDGALNWKSLPAPEAFKISDD